MTKGRKQVDLKVQWKRKMDVFNSFEEKSFSEERRREEKFKKNEKG